MMTLIFNKPNPTNCSFINRFHSMRNYYRKMLQPEFFVLSIFTSKVNLKLTECQNKIQFGSNVILKTSLFTPAVNIVN